MWDSIRPLFVSKPKKLLAKVAWSQKASKGEQPHHRQLQKDIKILRPLLHTFYEVLFTTVI